MNKKSQGYHKEMMKEIKGNQKKVPRISKGNHNEIRRHEKEMIPTGFSRRLRTEKPGFDSHPDPNLSASCAIMLL